MGEANVNARQKFLEDTVMRRFEFTLEVLKAGYTVEQVEQAYKKLFAPAPEKPEGE